MFFAFTARIYSSSVGLFSVDIEDSSKKIRDRFGEISESLGDYIEKTNKIKANLEELTESFQNQVETFDTSYHKRLLQFQNELDSIDELIESFIEAVKKKISTI